MSTENIYSHKTPFPITMETKKEEMGFPATINKDGRILIPPSIRRMLDLNWRDDVYIVIRKTGSGEGNV